MTARRPPTVSVEAWELAVSVCTPAELVALELSERGLGQNTIALYLGISRGAVRSRLVNARRKLALTDQEDAA